MPVLVNPSLFGAPAAAGAGYAAAVLADSPWGFWKLTETDNSSGATLADASTNARNMSLTNSSGSPTMSQTGPSSFMPGILWPAGDATSASTSVNFNTSTGTVEVWFYLTANPASRMGLAACQNNAGGSITKFLAIETDGRISFGLSGSTSATSASAVSLNTWHHAVGSVGAAGTKLRLDKTTVATLSNTSSSSTGLPARLPGKLGSATNTPGAVLTTAACAVWNSQLTDAKTDAHYDAMFA